MGLEMRLRGTELIQMVADLERDVIEPDRAARGSRSIAP